MVKTFKNLLLQNQGCVILKQSMEHRGVKFYKMYINNDPRLTLTYFRTSKIWSHLLQLAADGQSDRRFMFLNKYLTPWYCLGYIHVYDHYFQTAVPSLKLLSQSKPNFMWSLLEKRGHKVIKMIMVTAMPIYILNKNRNFSLPLFFYENNLYVKFINIQFSVDRCK